MPLPEALRVGRHVVPRRPARGAVKREVLEWTADPIDLVRKRRLQEPDVFEHDARDGLAGDVVRELGGKRANA